MDRNLADKLVGQLERHPKLEWWVLTKRVELVEILASTEVPPQSQRFHETIKDNLQILDEDGSDVSAHLSLRRVLRNNRASEYRLSYIKYLYESAVASLGIYDSDVITRKLRLDKEIVRMMAESKEPFSLLGRLTIDNSYKKTQEDGPILLIPDAEYSPRILNFEEANTYKGGYPILPDNKPQSCIRVL